MSEEIKENTVETTAEPAETVNEAPELTVNDLTAIKQVIDVASQRGAFKPNEMVSVGTIYSKLELFLNAVQAQQPKGE
jgi:hypothetical protein|tara:strand:+ start:2876 stop:3109 length:234 start_codon:yes stop_codon:yes gene_type:complete